MENAVSWEKTVREGTGFHGRSATSGKEGAAHEEGGPDGFSPLAPFHVHRPSQETRSFLQERRFHGFFPSGKTGVDGESIILVFFIYVYEFKIQVMLIFLNKILFTVLISLRKVVLISLRVLPLTDDDGATGEGTLEGVEGREDVVEPSPGEMGTNGGKGRKLVDELSTPLLLPIPKRKEK